MDQWTGQGAPGWAHPSTTAQTTPEPEVHMAPKSLDFNKGIPPKAVQSSANRTFFTPENGGAFSPSTGTSTIRIPVNANAYLNGGESYLQFTVTNDGADAGSFLCPDLGVPWFRRLRIESAGATIEDSGLGYNRLYGMLELAQLSCGQIRQSESIHTCANEFGRLFDQSVCTTECQRAGHLGMGSIAAGASRTYSVPLVSGLLSQEKLIPMALLNSGFTLVLELADGTDVGVSTQILGSIAGPNYAVNYSINSVRYCAALTSVTEDFTQMLRQEMAQSGGHLTLHGQTWHSYIASLPAGAGGQVNIPARVRSLKTLLSTFAAVPGTAGIRQASFQTSDYSRQGVSQWNYRVGSQPYPETAVSVGVTTLAETYAELMKCFGTALGTTDHENAMNYGNYAANVQALAVAPTPGAATYASDTARRVVGTFAIGYDCDAFANASAINAGVDTASRSLQITLEVVRPAVAADAPACTVTSWACSDIVFYVGQDGAMHSIN